MVSRATGPEAKQGVVMVLWGSCWIAAVLLAQAPGAEAPKFDPTRWEDTIGRFVEQDAKQPPKTGGVLFVGSSSIRLWPLDESFPELSATNRGFGGSHVADVVHYVDRIVFPYEPRTIVLYAGDNDIAGGKTPERVRDDVRRFVRRVHAELPESRILYVAIKPSLRRWSMWPEMKQANDLIAADFAEDERLHFVDIAEPMLGEDGKPRPELFVKDGLHLSPAGYAVWSKELRPLLAE